MTEIEKTVYNNTNLVEIVVVVDLAEPVDELVSRFKSMVVRHDESANTWFANRFKHYCDGGLIMLQEREEFGRLIKEAGERERAKQAG
jgi:hypothetical protein